jgi:hypothetical protein
MRQKSALAPALWSSVLLLAVVAAAFCVPVFPRELHHLLYRVLFSIIYFSAVMNMERNRQRWLLFSILVVVLDSGSDFMDAPYLRAAARLLNMLFFSCVVVTLIRQVARARSVNRQVILESITGYLLMGIVFAIVVATIGHLDPAAFNFTGQRSGDTSIAADFSQDLYFTNITLATVGYGDMLPLKSYARSLATLIGMSGQLYIAIIIAMLVGKFSSEPRRERKN